MKKYIIIDLNHQKTLDKADNIESILAIATMFDTYEEAESYAKMISGSNGHTFRIYETKTNINAKHKPKIKGEWIPATYNNYDYMCNQCHGLTTAKGYECPYCGASMKVD